MVIKISVVIPTYNEEGNIEPLLKQVHEVLTADAISHELIVVDDGSRDQTRSRVKNLKSQIPEIVLIERDNERGLASAMVCGYNAARGQYLGAMDADLAHNPIYLVPMIQILDAGAADLIIGSRYLPDSRFEGKPLANKLASVIGQFLIKIILGVKAKDTSNNYRVFRREIWGKINKRLHPNGNIMLTEIIYLTQRQGFRISEIPIIYKERRAGKSKLNLLEETWRFGKNILKIKFDR